MLPTRYLIATASLARALPRVGTALPRPVRTLFGLDAIVIATFLGLHAAGWAAGHRAQWLMLDVDHSLPEILLYGKWMAVLLLLAWAAQRGGGPLCTALAATFLIILVDDGFRIHERGGEVLSEALRLEGVLGLRPRDVGELIVWAGLGTAVLLNLTIGFAMATPGERLAARPLLFTFVALLVAGIGVDMAHVLVAGTVANHPLEKPVNVLMILLEDGAELLLGTVAVWLAMRQGFAASVPLKG